MIRILMLSTAPALPASKQPAGGPSAPAKGGAR